MKTWKQKLALSLAFSMLVSVMPMNVFAAGQTSSDVSDEVVYNLQDMDVIVGYDEEEAEVSEEPYVLFEEDGSYTIMLEDDAFFPYEVQFTCGGETTQEWFMTPEDCVEIGGHDFYVKSYQSDPTRLNQLGVWINGEYVPAYPEEKEFTNEPQGSTFSMMPLTEYECTLDLTSYFPDELKAVQVSTVLDALEQRFSTEIDPSDLVVWTKGYAYDNNDDYEIVGQNDTLDLSPISRYNNQFQLELIVGTADQLDLNNVRYIVSVCLMDADEFFSFDLQTEDRSKAIEVYDSFKSYRRNGDGSETDIYYIDVNPADWKHGDEAYLSISFADELSNNGLTASVYVGMYDTETIPTLTEEVDITDQIWDQADLSVSGGYLGDYGWKRGYEGMTELTIAVYRDRQLVQAVPFMVYVNEGVPNVYLDGLYVDGNSVEGGTSYEYNSGHEIVKIELKPGYAVDGTYQLNLRLDHPKDKTYNSGISYVEKAVIGKYASLEAASGATDIKEQLFTDTWSRVGYAADFSNGVVFTVFDTEGNVHHIEIRTVQKELPDPSEPDEIDTYFRMTGAMEAVPQGENSYTAGDSYSAYVMPAAHDSYYYKHGYQTVFLLKDDGTAVTDEKIIPVFTLGNGVVGHLGENHESTREVVSGVDAIDFIHNQPMHYSAKAESQEHQKNYYVTFLTQQSGPKLFVNGTNNPDHWDEETNQPIREVFLTEEYNYHHDVFFANVGDEKLTDLYVKLENAQNIKLDPYWTIGETTTLSAFTTVNDDQTQNGELANVGKIRLLPDEEHAGTISGTLIIGSETDEVKIELTGLGGIPKIVTETIRDGVKYVPYSSIIQTNSMGDSDAVVFALTEGTLPQGMEIKPNGEIYGVPQESGEFTFTVTMTYKDAPSMTCSKEFTIKILENTDENVEAVNSDDQGYVLNDRIENIIGAITDTVFISDGDYAQFIDFWMDGKKLVKDVDYTHEEGSTKITIREQTFRNAGNGTHTIAAEFRTGGFTNLNSDLKRTAQNFTVDLGSSGSNAPSGNKPSGGNSNNDNNHYTPVKYQITATTSENGTISMDSSNVTAGSTVTVTVTPNQGFEVKELIVKDHAGKRVDVVRNSNGKFTFKMPTGRVTVQAVFEKIPEPAEGTPFVDVKETDWFYEAVKFAYQNNLMAGTAADNFAPNMTSSRGMIVTILFNQEDQPEVSNSYFSDVPLNRYYAKAASWAAENGIVSGYGDGKFGAENDVSREQLVIIMMNYARYKGMSVDKRADLNTFTDCDQIDTIAMDAMSWAHAEGLVNGKGNGIMDPKGTATRAEMASIMKAFCELVDGN